MIEVFGTIDGLEGALASKKIERDVDSLLKLDLPFYDYEDRVSVSYFPMYPDNRERCLVFITKKDVLVYSSISLNNYERKYKTILKKPRSESTIITFLVLKAVLKNYSEQFQKIRDRINELEMQPVLDKIEDSGRALRRLTDKIESLVELIIVLKQREIKQFDVSLV